MSSQRARALLAGVAAVLMAVAPAAVAHADPSVSDVEAQINALWSESEPLIEQYNAVHEQFVANQARQAELEAQIAPLQEQIDAVEVQVGNVAARAYQGSSTGVFGIIVSGGSPAELADQLTYLDYLAHDQRVLVSSALELKAEFDAQKAPIDELTAQLAAQDADLAQRRQDIESRMDQLQDLRRQVYTTTNGTGSLRPWPCPAEYAPTPGYAAAAFACAQAGASYVWAAAGPDSYDCSGLTMMAWRAAGVYLPHNAAAQRASMAYVDRSQLQLGDLVFVYSDLSHVAIYVGGGKVMNASTYGVPVKMMELDDVGPIHSFGRPA